jgi:hypothetical protein
LPTDNPLRDKILRTFNKRHVGIVEFAESDEFCNKPLYPHQRVLLKIIHLEELEGWEEDILTDWIRGGWKNEVEISPKIRERMDFLRDTGYKHFKEIDLVGGRRSGKGYISAISAVKKIWETQQLGDPGAYYGIDSRKEIYFTTVAASLDQARQFQFADIKDTAASCDALTPFIPSILEESFTVKTESDERYIERLKKAGIRVEANFAKLRVRPLAAQAGTIRGSASLVIIFDEMAHMIGTDGKASAEDVYQAAIPATRTFGIDSMIFANSSPWTKEGQFYTNVENAMAVDENGDAKFPHVFAFRYPSWEMYRAYDKDPNRRFKRAIMVSPDWPDEFLLSKQDKAAQYEERLEEQKNPAVYRVEYRSQWQEALDAYLDPLLVERAFQPFYLDNPIEPSNGGRNIYLYYGHCDPSSTIAGFGAAMAHIERWPSEHFDGQMADHVVFDFVKRWDPADFKDHTINYMHVQKEILHFINLYRPDRFTFDQHQSTGLVQWLQQNVGTIGAATQVSVWHFTQAKNAEMWENFRTALYLDLVHVPPTQGLLNSHPKYAELELKSLITKNGRVDKQETGPIQTKDIADCIAMCTTQLIGEYVRNFNARSIGSLPLLSGSQGGYGIGKGMDIFNEPVITPNSSPHGALSSIYNRQQVSGAGARETTRNFNPMRRRR